MKLSVAQQAAVERSGQDVCVVAGPGSGKTRVLVERFAWLVEHDVSPLRILAITFTEKAANEIKQRLVDHFKQQPKERAGIERAYVSTIHSFCARLLRENAVVAGLDPGFTIQEDAVGAVDTFQAAEETLDALLEEKPDVMGGLLAGFSNRDLARDLVDVYDAIRSAGTPLDGAALVAEPGGGAQIDRLHEAVREVLEGPADGWNPKQKEYLAAQREWAQSALERAIVPCWRDCLQVLSSFACNLNKVKRGSEISAALKSIRDDLLKPARAAVIGAFFERERRLLQEALVRFDALYRKQKRAAAVLDFADLEEHTIRMLSERPAVRARIRQSFDAILMDELQDTNPLQWRLVDLIRREGRFYAVGDINQSIYGFRHADPEVFRRYRGSLEERQLPVDLLVENYRSRPEILDAVLRMFEGAPGIEPMKLEPRGEFVAKDIPSVEVLAAFGENSAAGSELEARWLARRIRELEGKLIVGPPDKPRTACFSDMAVLIRTAACVEPLAKAFAEFQIPFLQTKGRTFFAVREVLDLLNYLRVLANPCDEVSLAAVLRSPLAGASDETLARIKMHGELWTSLKKLEALAAGCDAGDVERLLAARACIVNARKLAADVSPDLLVARALDESGYLEGLDGRARANIEKFLDMIRGYAAAAPGTLSQLIEWLDAQRAEQPEPEAPPTEAANAVSVMTIHAAKGLQFPIVFAAALHKETNKQTASLVYRAESGLGARWRDPSNGESIADSAHNLASDLEKQREAREADRLLFVAMTRAEEHLVLSFADTKRMSAWAGQVAAKLGGDLKNQDGKPITVDGVRVFRTGNAPPPADLPTSAGAATEPLDLDRPEVSGQHDSTTTATAVALFKACPRKYFLRSYLGWPETPEDVLDFEHEEREAPMDASELGVQVHALLAGTAVESPARESLELAARFTSSGLGLRAGRADRIEREFDFLVALDDVILRGQMDLWFEEGGELILIDYKTDRHEDRASSYAVQLQLYALALERIRGRLPDRAVLCYLRSGHEVEVPLDAASLESARASVRALSRAQDSLEFPLQEGEQCVRCGYYRGVCPAGKVIQS
ncbi:MAG: UvrD-helicase domain-containing protein [Bryobacteraceae bacterium]